MRSESVGLDKEEGFGATVVGAIDDGADGQTERQTEFVTGSTDSYTAGGQSGVGGCDGMITHSSTFLRVVYRLELDFSEAKVSST